MLMPDEILRERVSTVGGFGLVYVRGCKRAGYFCSLARHTAQAEWPSFIKERSTTMDQGTRHVLTVTSHEDAGVAIIK